MITLYKERGHVDLLLTDLPYNTGKDFRYNDRWYEDPNDPGPGELILVEDGARHTKWLRSDVAPSSGDARHAQAGRRARYLHRLPRAVPPRGDVG